MNYLDSIFNDIILELSIIWDKEENFMTHVDKVPCQVDGGSYDTIGLRIEYVKSKCYSHCYLKCLSIKLLPLLCNKIEFNSITLILSDIL